MSFPGVEDMKDVRSQPPSLMRTSVPRRTEYESWSPETTCSLPAPSSCWSKSSTENSKASSTTSALVRELTNATRISTVVPINTLICASWPLILFWFTSCGE